MSPAGLKGVAEEVGLEMVVIAGNNMGDIFRRNSFNLGLHVVQSPEAVADAQDGDEFSFDPVTRKLRNETQKKDYDPVPLSAKEEEIRRSGGIFTVGRNEFKQSVVTKPSVDWADPADARRMTSTEQIIFAHRVDKSMKASELKPGATRPRLCGPAAGFRRHRAVLDPHLQPDHRRQHDPAAPGRDRERPLRVHRRRRRRQADQHRP